MLNVQAQTHHLVFNALQDLPKQQATLAREFVEEFTAWSVKVPVNAQNVWMGTLPTEQDVKPVQLPTVSSVCQHN